MCPWTACSVYSQLDDWLNLSLALGLSVLHHPYSGPHVPIDGALFTVNPIAVNKNVNVFTLNKRVVRYYRSSCAVGCWMT